MRGYRAGVDWSTLVFAAVAAVAAVLAAAWGWSDRPQHGWYIHRETDHGTEFRKAKMTFTVRAVGTAVAHNVEVRVVGARYSTSVRVSQPQMGVGSESIVIEVWLPEQPQPPAYIEIVWARLRPYQEYGQRVDARSMAWEQWRWHWRSICLRRRPGRSCWTTRLVRTSGGWRPDRGLPRASIPLTVKERDSSPAGDGSGGDESPPG